MEDSKAKELIKRYLNGDCTDEEKATVESWYLNEVSQQEDELPVAEYEATQQEIWNIINNKRNIVVKSQSVLRYLPVAAAVLIILSAGMYFLNTRYGVSTPENRWSNSEQDVAPGKNKATLTLANGKVIDLSNAGNGKLAMQAGIIITKTKDGQLIYTLSAANRSTAAGERHSNTADLSNTIATPKGGQYQVQLPDGTSVWLNAASSLKFPASFAKLKERIVELKGEAYFAVKHNVKQPFKVLTAGQTVEDIGTEFNVSAYPDESYTKTTLIEGSARVIANYALPSVVLIPAQQAVLYAGQLKVTAADTEEAIAWKKGEFMFNNQDLESIMKKISRWYDVEVIYQDNQMRKEVFGGTISRFRKVSKVLEMLEMTGAVHFKIEGRRITVAK